MKGSVLQNVVKNAPGVYFHFWKYGKDFYILKQDMSKYDGGTRIWSEFIEVDKDEFMRASEDLEQENSENSWECGVMGGWGSINDI
jgi:hypothetical protein